MMPLWQGTYTPKLHGAWTLLIATRHVEEFEAIDLTSRIQLFNVTAIYRSIVDFRFTLPCQLPYFDTRPS